MLAKKFIILFISIMFFNLYFKDSMAHDTVLITDPRVLAIEIKDCGEHFIDIISLNGDEAVLYGPSPEIENNTDYTFMRISVYNKIKEANEILKPYGVKLCLYEALRSLSLQKMLFDNCYDKFKKMFPEKTDDEIFIETTKAVSPVINLDGTKNVPAHSTGGAIDIYLVYSDTLELVDMGSHPKDPFIEEISKTNSTIISEEARKNRALMGWALSQVGFVNYPTEYWHWSYGDRYWAFVKGEENAIYGGR